MTDTTDTTTAALVDELRILTGGTRPPECNLNKVAARSAQTLLDAGMIRTSLNTAGTGLYALTEPGLSALAGYRGEYGTGVHRPISDVARPVGEDPDARVCGYCTEVIQDQPVPFPCPDVVAYWPDLPLPTDVWELSKVDTAAGDPNGIFERLTEQLGYARATKLWQSMCADQDNATEIKHEREVLNLKVGDAVTAVDTALTALGVLCSNRVFDVPLAETTAGEEIKQFLDTARGQLRAAQILTREATR